MSVAAAVLLAVGLGAVSLSAAGIVLVREPYQRLHFLTPATTVGATAIVIALMIVEPHPGRATVKLALILAILLLAGPVITMATARARSRADQLFPEDSPK